MGSYARAGIAVASLCALVACKSPERTGPPSGDGVSPAAAPPPEAPPVVVYRKPHGPTTDGAKTPSSVYELAKEAYAANDYVAVYGAVLPETRKAWLSELAFGGELASMGRMSEAGARRKALEELHATFEAYGATLSVEQRMAGMAIEDMPKMLLAKVDDPAGFFAAILGWADRQGASTDPMKALSDPKVLAATLQPGSIVPDLDATARIETASDSGMGRVLGRLAVGAPLAIQVTGDSATGTTKPAAGKPLRFAKEAGAWFITE